MSSEARAITKEDLNIPPLYTAYHALMLANPNAIIDELGEILHEKKDELEKLVGELPILQRTPLGVNCNDLGQHRWELNRIGYPTDTKYGNDYLLKQIVLLI